MKRKRTAAAEPLELHIQFTMEEKARQLMKNGVVVIPKKRSLEIAKRALYVKEKEERVKKEIDSGKTLGQILELGKWEKI